MSRLLDAYRALHEQAFIPIFVQDGFDSRALLDGCLEAGVRVIEYTLRRPDADRMIPWIRARYPELYLLVGSTLDDERIVAHGRRQHPQLRTVRELADMGVDGFVSMLAWHEDNIRKYSGTHLLLPCADTVNEAFLQVSAGAHFAKILGPGLELARACRAAPTFGFCPLMITGGMTLERIPEAMAAEVMLAGTGFDVILRGEAPDISARKVTEKLAPFVRLAQERRAQRWPALAAAANLADWLAALPHVHPFGDVANA